jgi:hypothetical protein
VQKDRIKKERERERERSPAARRCLDRDSFRVNQSSTSTMSSAWSERDLPPAPKMSKKNEEGLPENGGQSQKQICQRSQAD